MNKLTDCNRCMGILFFMFCIGALILMIWLFGSDPKVKDYLLAALVVLTGGAKEATSMISSGVEAKKDQAKANIETAKVAAANPAAPIPPLVPPVAG